MLKDIVPIIPVLIVTLSACAVLIAESFRRKDDWMPMEVDHKNSTRRHPA